MEGKTDDLSDKIIRRIVKKDSDSRLRAELLGCQSLLTQTEIDSLPRATLVGYVRLIRQLNKSSISCRNKIPDFDPKNSKISDVDDEEVAKSKSLSDDIILGEESILSKSHTMTQSIGPTNESSDIVRSIDFLIAMQREERIERQRKEDLKEIKDKELLEMRERKETEERNERWRIEREDKKERERVKEEKEAREQKEKDEKHKMKEEKEAKELRIKEEKEAKELKDNQQRLQDQLDRDQRKAELEAMFVRDKLEREDKERARDEKEQRERQIRLEEIERDRIFRESKYQEEKNERLAKESRKDVRLKRATDILKGRFTEQPEDMKMLVIFFKSFESSFAIYGIDEDLKVPIMLPYLNTRSKQLVLGLDVGATFEQVKASIMSEYNFTSKMYHSAFIHSFRSVGESSVQFVTRLACLLDLYLESRGVNKNYEKLIELLISDRFRESLDEEMRHYVADHEFDSWLVPKKMAQLVDAYQSERHSNWNYLRNPKNFMNKSSNSINKTQGASNFKHQYIKYDKTRMYCTYCRGKGHLISSCFKLTGKSDKSQDSQRSQGSHGSHHGQKSEARVRKCYICDSRAHLAPACPEKKPRKTYNAKRVIINSVVQNLC